MNAAVYEKAIFMYFSKSNSNNYIANTRLSCSKVDTLLCSTKRPAYRGEAAAHAPVGHREAGLVDGLFKHQVNDSFEPLLSVDGQVRHLLHELVELLRRQLVQDTTDLLEQVLRE